MFFQVTRITTKHEKYGLKIGISNRLANRQRGNNVKMAQLIENTGRQRSLIAPISSIFEGPKLDGKKAQFWRWATPYGGKEHGKIGEWRYA
jgi:hypothetical protein